MKDTIIEYAKAFALLLLVIGLIYWTFKSFSMVIGLPDPHVPPWGCCS